MIRSCTDILAELKTNAGRHFAESRSLPPAIYHDAEIHALELDRIFRREWICIGRSVEMPERGDFICRTIADSPVFAIRQKDKQLRAFSNVCRHRAARLLSGDGHVSRISCPYHSWTYDLDGQLIGAPFMDKTAAFSTADIRLASLPCEEWEGFVYVALNEPSSSVAEKLSGLQQRIADFRVADYVPVFSIEETWDANWKCLVENFMDSYHIHRVHKESFGKYGNYEDVTFLESGDDSFSYTYVQSDDEPGNWSAHPDNTWLKGDDRTRTYIINIFPSHMIQLQPDMLWYLSILPESSERLGVRWAVSIAPEILHAADDRQAAIDDELNLIKQVNEEDRVIVENVSATTRSAHAVQGPLSHLEQNVWDFGRYLARMLTRDGAN